MNALDKSPLAMQAQLAKWKTQHFPKLAALAQSRDEAEKLFTICMNTISKTRGLTDCTFASIQNCIMTSFQLKLYPGPMQECAYIPFKETATFIPQYQGIVKLCYNSGFITSIKSLVVWEGEHFYYSEGLKTTLEHTPDLDIDHSKSQRVAVYCVVNTKWGDQQIAVLTPRFIAGIKAASRGASKSDSPWNNTNTDVVDWMWRKTALKQALKLIPKSPEVYQAVELDNSIDADFTRGNGAIDLELTLPNDIEPSEEEPRNETKGLSAPSTPVDFSKPAREPTSLEVSQERVRSILAKGEQV